MIEIRNFTTAEDVRKWVFAAKPGAVIEYHRGDGTKGLNPQVQSELLKISERLLDTFAPQSFPQFFMFQKRLAPFLFSYRVMKLTPVMAKKLNQVGEPM